MAKEPRRSQAIRDRQRLTRGESRSEQKAPARAEQLAVAWAGVTLVTIGAAGLQFAPRHHLLWVILLIFGAATIPQVMIWWTTAKRESDRERRR